MTTLVPSKPPLPHHLFSSAEITARIPKKKTGEVENAKDRILLLLKWASILQAIVSNMNVDFYLSQWN